MRRFVGYLEEEAVKTYTDILDAIDNGATPATLRLTCVRVNGHALE